jgi:hypothetical protein
MDSQSVDSGSLLVLVTQEYSKRSFIRFCILGAPSTAKCIYMSALSTSLP